MIALQLFTVAFAVACAYINQFAVILFRNWGSTPKAQFRFHAVNAGLKVLWAVVPFAYHFRDVTKMILLSVLLLLIQWLVFDIALNLFTDKPMFYLGQTAWLDKLIKNGKVKAIVLVVLIVVLNYLMKFFS